MIRSAGWYEGWLRDAIVHFKYQGEYARADHLADLLSPTVTTMGSVDALVPVPMHRNRVAERGYNQSALLARRVANGTALPVSDALARIRETVQQTMLHADQRRANVASAFSVPTPRLVAGMRLLLIDDVLTTGATLSACADALAAAGATWVGAATLARDR
jgi:ComF family protein